MSGLPFGLWNPDEDVRCHECGEVIEKDDPRQLSEDDEGHLFCADCTAKAIEAQKPIEPDGWNPAWGERP